MNFYQRYVELCAKRGKSPSAVALQNGFSKATVTGWKNGKTNPTDVTLSKLAAYFNVSINYLIGADESEAKEKTAPIAESGLSADELDFILLYRSLSSEKKEALRILAEQK